MLPILIIRNFNPRAPYGARPRKQRLINAFTNFNPRAPYGARPQELFGICLQTNFNPRAPYGARLDPKYIKDMYHAISIHAPHTGRDWSSGGGLMPNYEDFNPRAPYGARRYGIGGVDFFCIFQSTRPIRGATVTGMKFITVLTFQSTRPIRGATDEISKLFANIKISIHAPHTGRDSKNA